MFMKPFRAIKRYFRDCKKYMVKTYYAKNGIECLYCVYTHISRKVPIHLVLIDENMPFLGGVSTCKIIKSAPEMRAIPVYILSSGSPVAFRDIGAEGHYDKPLTVSNFRKIMEQSGNIIENFDDEPY